MADSMTSSVSSSSSLLSMAPSSFSASSCILLSATTSLNDVLFGCSFDWEPCKVVLLRLWDSELLGGGALCESTLCSKDDSSSSDDPPSVKMPALIGGGAFVFSLDEGTGCIPMLVLRCRKDEVAGEKPWTTDPERIKPSEETEVSESRCSLWRAIVLLVAVVVADKHDSVESCIGLDSSSCSTFGIEEGSGSAGTLACMEGDKGHRAVFSFIVTMIFSSASGVKWRDFERELAHSSCPKDLDRVESGFSFKLSSEEKEWDNEGARDTVGGESTGVTHRDSRDHTRQLMFSYLWPSLMVSEHLLNIVHIAFRLMALAGSIWCIFSASSCRTSGTGQDAISSGISGGIEPEIGGGRRGRRKV